MTSSFTMMNADTIAEELLAGTGLSTIDLARLALETIEELGGRKRKNVLVRLREVMRAGVQAVKAAERTVSFRKAAEQSIAERRDLRPTSLRDIRHYVRHSQRARPLHSPRLATPLARPTPRGRFFPLGTRCSAPHFRQLPRRTFPQPPRSPA